MSRAAAAISAVVAVLVMGCVSVGPEQTPPPTLGPSFAVTTPAPSPSASLTASPAATATPTQAPTPKGGPTEDPTAGAPTLAPTASPAPPLTPAPSTTVIEDFGADELLFTDDFSDATSGFGIGSNAGGTVAYTDGALQFDTASDGAWMWSRRTDPLSYNVLHVEADMTPSATGYAGLLCANTDVELWGAVANAAGLWVFIRLDSDGSTILTSSQQAGFEITPGVTTRMALDCASKATGQFRMQLSLPDLGLAALYEGGTDEGDQSFDRAGVYAESSADPFQLRVDNLVVYGGDGETGISPEARALLLHLPADWRADCFETPPSMFDTGAEASVSCPLADGRSNVADFVQFDTQANMDAAYQARVDTWAVESTDSCQTGPNETGYTIGGAPAGRILCAPQTVGIRIDWTHDSLLILSTLTNFNGSYVDAYEDWLIAGPE